MTLALAVGRDANAARARLVERFRGRLEPRQRRPVQGRGEGPIDVVVRRHEYAVGGSTGWHQHPYPVFITSSRDSSRSTTRTTRPARRSSCPPGGGYVDSGKGHLGPQRVAAPGDRHQRDHGAGGRRVPLGAPRTRTQLRASDAARSHCSASGGAHASGLRVHAAVVRSRDACPACPTSRLRWDHDGPRPRIDA